MGFDKATYDKRRAAGERGQDSLPEPTLFKESGITIVTFPKFNSITRKFEMVKEPRNRRQRRVRSIARDFRKKRLTQVGATHIVKEFEHPRPSQPPSMNNHDRHTLRRAKRELAKTNMDMAGAAS